MSENWLSPQDVGRELGISAHSVYRAINSGALSAYRFGSRRQGDTDRRGLSISRAALDTFIERSRVRPRVRSRVRPAFSGADLMETARRMAIRGRR